MFKNLLSLLFLFCSLNLFSQQKVLLEGKIIDSETSIPIPQATIKLVNSNNFTTSNTEGNFVVSTLQNGMDTLVVSSMGFAPLKVAVSSLKKSMLNVITLNPNIISLNDVTISPIKITALISNAIKASEAKSGGSSTILTGYYKEVVKRDSILSKYADGIISYYIEPKVHNKVKIGIQVLESRAREITLPAEEDKMNGLNTPISIRDLGIFASPTSFFILDTVNLISYQYKLTEFEDHNRAVYAVYFEPIVGSKKSLYTGKLYIDKETLLILGLDYSVAKVSLPFLKTINLLGYKVSSTSRSLSLRYKIDDHNYYLSYVGKTFGMRVSSKRYNQLNDFRSEFWLTQAETENCVPFTNTYSKDQLYKRRTNYKTEYWKNPNLISNTQEEKEFILSEK